MCFWYRLMVRGCYLSAQPLEAALDRMLPNLPYMEPTVSPRPRPQFHREEVRLIAPAETSSRDARVSSRFRVGALGEWGRDAPKQGKLLFASALR